MRRVKYPSDIKELGFLHSRYYATLGINTSQKLWTELRKRIPAGNKYPKKLSDIVFADYHHLCSYYRTYINHPIKDTSDLKQVQDIFNYSAKHDKIASFFMNKTNGFDLSVCSYCEMAFINVYSVDRTSEGIDFINNADVLLLQRKLKLSSATIPKRIVKSRPITSVSEFNKFFPKSTNKFHAIFSKLEAENHFDLDHVLDKASCPLVALSFYNLVPCCPVCNERLKGRRILNKGHLPGEMISPTSPDFDFDGNSEFVVIPKDVGLDYTNKSYNPDMFDIRLKVTSDYEDFSKIFKLEERYNYHKMVALHWSDMAVRYNRSRIELMANAINNSNYSVERIEEDIFQKRMDDEGKNCFSKLKRDMLK